MVLPNWVGDVVLATPILRALAAQLDDVETHYLMRPYVREIVAGADWFHGALYWSAQRGLARPLADRRTAVEIAQLKCDAALLLTNSFRSAAVTRLAGIQRRIGYARDGRGWLLTERLTPLRWRRMYVPVPMGPYYAALAERLGVQVEDWRLELPTTPEQDAAAAELLAHHNLTPGRYVVVNPGAAFGAAKCWPPEHFAAVCDAAPTELGLHPVLVGAPNEASLLHQIAALCRQRPTICENPGTTLGSLKGVIRDAALLICNDTGPRHYGLAFATPTVTIFGPTHQEWTDTPDALEMKVQLTVACGPCQLKRCPLDHRCLRQLMPERVLAAAKRLLPSPLEPAAMTTLGRN